PRHTRDQVASGIRSNARAGFIINFEEGEVSTAPISYLLAQKTHADIAGAGFPRLGTTLAGTVGGILRRKVARSGHSMRVSTEDMPCNSTSTGSGPVIPT